MRLSVWFSSDDGSHLGESVTISMNNSDLEENTSLNRLEALLLLGAVSARKKINGEMEKTESTTNP